MYNTIVNNMLYFIFTVDGDWMEYFEVKLPEGERVPRPDIVQELIQREIEMAQRVLNGRFIHFIHTSPLERDFFLKEPFPRLWKEIRENGGDIGLHCHEDDSYKDYFWQDAFRMKRVVSERVRTFKNAGLSVECYRGGFMCFSDEMVRVLEENRIGFDFSCEPGRFLKQGDKLVSDWRGAPEMHYRMSYSSRSKPGDSNVWEIPVGTSKGKYLYFEKSSAEEIGKIALDLKERSVQNKCDIVVSVLSHTYDYASIDVIKATEEKLTLLKRHGTFINLKELQKIITAS